MMQFNELLARFKTDEDCKRYLVARRWPDGKVSCPRCGNQKVFHATHRPFHWICKAKDCGGRNGYRFSVITKTIFENTKYPLVEWFKVMFLMMHSKKGMSALQIHRMLGTGSYETAWYMCTRVRAAMKGDGWTQLMGVVEVDETAIGGKDKNRHWDKKQHITGMSGKTTVIGAISRKGNVVCQVIENTDAPTLHRFVRKAVSDKVSLVATDEHRGYDNLDAGGFKHETIRHGAGEYVRGTVHTNNIESLWSLLKRGIVGTYHNVSKDYLPLYLAEFSFRHNHRKDSDMFGKIVAGC
jgi:transposase-like protein